MAPAVNRNRTSVRRNKRRAGMQPASCKGVVVLGRICVCLKSDAEQKAVLNGERDKRYRAFLLSGTPVEKAVKSAAVLTGKLGLHKHKSSFSLPSAVAGRSSGVATTFNIRSGKERLWTHSTSAWVSASSRSPIMTICCPRRSNSLELINVGRTNIRTMLSANARYRSAPMR